ncbi:MAG: vitamin B12 dependent-methionine synthase activation domain-containing protein [Tissierellia bacterium]|nr:vitamin B12 dependent-methionine synthase activation domain-containing protein [Tissierellia bacterium]
MDQHRTILQAMKFIHTVPEDTFSYEKLKSLFELYQDSISPILTEKRFPMDQWIEHPPFLLEGKDVEELLVHGEEIVFFGATLGMTWERKLMELSISDPKEGFFLDGLLSAIVEERLNMFQEELSKEVRPKYVTDRFSPGYGDLPFSQQRKWGELLDIRKTLGVQFTDRDLMIPRKTVLALCVITKEKPLYRHRGCDSCLLYKECPLRIKGSRCSIYGG